MAVHLDTGFVAYRGCAADGGVDSSHYAFVPSPAAAAGISLNIQLQVTECRADLVEFRVERRFVEEEDLAVAAFR